MYSARESAVEGLSVTETPQCVYNYVYVYHVPIIAVIAVGVAPNKFVRFTSVGSYT